MLDDLEVHHDVHRAVGQRKLREIAVAHVHPGVTRTHVGDRGLVVVQPDHRSRDIGDQVGAVPFAAAGLQHVAPGASVA